MGSCEYTEQNLKQILSDLPIGDIYYFDTIGSTNDYGFKCAEAGAPDLTVITAFEQTSGRGRMHRKWVTVPGTSLPMTVVIRPHPGEIDYLNLFSPLTGLAVREALADGWGIESEIKWPNDVLLNRKKICGILCETLWEGDQMKSLILGLGTNLLHGAAPDIPNLTYPASSVEDETGIIIPRLDWIRLFLEQLIRLRPLVGKPEFFDLWKNSLAYKGETITLVHMNGTVDRGIIEGIDIEGSLLIRNDDGQIRKYLAGEISLRPVQKV